MNPGSLTFKSTDSSGAAKSAFNAGDTVYFSATGPNKSTTYPIYVVPHVSAWTVRVPFPNRVSGTATSVTTDSSGNIAVTNIYGSAQPGQYDIIVDRNANGKYDDNDLILTNVVSTPGAGIFVLPEYSYGLFMSIISCFAALVAYAVFKIKTGTPHFSAHKKIGL
jgi:hypothetical protein